MSKQDRIEKSKKKKMDLRIREFYAAYLKMCEQYGCRMDNDVYGDEVIVGPDHFYWYPPNKVKRRK